jgi:hypothetical protein
VDHCVGLVGYHGLTGNNPYWLVRNSWGDHWGEGGYLYVAYGSNQCNINSEPRNALIHHNGPVTPVPPPTPPRPTPVPPAPTPPPPTPVPVPTPPSNNSDWKERVCNNSDFTCAKDGCRDFTMTQGHCYPRPGHPGQSAKGKCTTGSATMREQVWHNSESCQGIWSEEIEWPLNLCMQDVGGTVWKKFYCPPFFHH